jgi:hypothetical protein
LFVPSIGCSSHSTNESYTPLGLEQADQSFAQKIVQKPQKTPRKKNKRNYESARHVEVRMKRALLL